MDGRFWFCLALLIEWIIFLILGLIDFLISNHPIAVILRDHLIFRIVPMLNPDGVYLGNQRLSFLVCFCFETVSAFSSNLHFFYSRSTLMGFDLNRSWHSISQWAHPTLYALYTAIKQYDQSSVTSNRFLYQFHYSASKFKINDISTNVWIN